MFQLGIGEEQALYNSSTCLTLLPVGSFLNCTATVLSHFERMGDFWVGTVHFAGLLTVMMAPSWQVGKQAHPSHQG